MIKIASRREAEKLLGRGVYTPSEAACYARVTTQLMTRWIYGAKAGLPVIAPELSGRDDRIVTFLDFVQSLAIRRIRIEHPGISLHKIRDAYETARKSFGVEYPFALESTRIGLYGPHDRPDRQEIWLLPKNEFDERRYYLISGKDKKNQVFAEVVLTYTSQLVYDDTTQLAKRYFPYPDGAVGTNGLRVVMDPEIHFGEPFIEKSEYTTQALYDAYRSEGGVSRAAEVCGVAEDEIILAIKYTDFIDKKPSAA